MAYPSCAKFGDFVFSRYSCYGANIHTHTHTPTYRRDNKTIILTLIRIVNDSRYVAKCFDAVSDISYELSFR